MNHQPYDQSRKAPVEMQYFRVLKEARTLGVYDLGLVLKVHGEASRNGGLSEAVALKHLRLLISRRAVVWRRRSASDAGPR